MVGGRSGPTRWLDRLYRGLLLAYPRSFRQAYGRQMREAFRDRCRGALERGGRLAVLAVAIRAIPDALRNGLLERVSGGAAWRPAAVPGLPPGAFRQALRRLARTPTFTLVTVLSVSLGVGAFASVASVADGVLVDPLPYANPDRLIWVWRDYTWIDFPRGWLGGPDVLALREQSDVFEDVVAFRSGHANLTGVAGQAPEEASVLLASDGFFDVLGVQPMLGRGFEAGESSPGAEPVAVLGNDLWRRRFGADPGVIGSRIQIDGEAWTVIGVMAPGFRFVKHSSLGQPEPADLYGSLRMDLPALPAGWGGLAGLARVHAGATDAAVDAALASASAEMDPYFGSDRLKLWGVDLRSDLVDGIRPALLALSIAASFLLLILTANLATLQYGRVAERSRDVAVRTALGGSRFAAVADILVESVLVAGAGCAAGLLLAGVAVRQLLAMAPASLPRREAIDVDLGVVSVTVLLALLMGVLAAAGPAVRASARGAAQVLRSSGSRAGSGRPAARTRSALVVIQVALSLMLLVGAGLVGRSAMLLLAADPGFESKGVLTWRVPLDEAAYPDEEAIIAFQDRFLNRVRTLPGVLAAGASNALPLSADTDQGPATFPGAEGNTGDADVDSPLVDAVSITPGYLDAMGIRLIAGRPFGTGDGAGSPRVALIDRTLAARFFTAGEATGRTLLYAGDTLTIVGVVDPARLYNVYSDERGQVYLPAARYPEQAMYYALRTDRDPMSLVPSVRGVLQSIDAALPLPGIRPGGDLVRESLGRHRLTLLLLTVFAGGALLLAAMGIWGVVAGGVIRRTPEIGVRLALGASAAGVLRLVATEGARVIGFGLVLGLAGSLAVSRLLGSLLFGIAGDDPLTYGTVAAFLLLVAGLACFVPALRATRIPPARALRGE